MKILFHENELNYRGTSIAMYDYADFNEKLLGNESFIAYHKHEKTNHIEGIEKFAKRFNVLAYEDFSEVDSFIKKNGIDLFYAIKNGNRDGIESKECKTAVHSVFKHYEPHGDVYAYVSEWLAQEMTNGNSPFVPHMVNFECDTEEDLRKELNIPTKAKVFGYYGGASSFDIDFVQQSIDQLSKKDKNYYFIFMGVAKFLKPRWWQRLNPNVIFLPATSDILRKLKFINTCDALLHARKRGETFGITVAEFALKGKPIITFADSPEKAHLIELENNAYLYRDKKELVEILTNADLRLSAKENYRKFLPAKVMEKFQSVFIS